MNKEDNILNKKEKNEIVSDVAAAINKAKGNILPKKKSKKVILMTVLVIVLIASAGTYWFLANNPKTIFVRSVDVAFDILSKNINEPKYEITKGKIDINIKSATGEYADLTRYNLTDNYVVDSLNDASLNNIKINYDDNHLLDLSLYNEGNNLYLFSDELLGKYIELDNINFAYEAKDIKTMLKSINTAINNSLDSEKVMGSRLSLIVNNKSVNAYKSSLVINSDNKDLILNNVGYYLQNDTRFINSYSKVFGIDNNKVKDEITNTINKLKNHNLDSFTINIYTEGVSHEFIKLELFENIGNQINEVSITDNGKNYEYLINLQSKNVKYEGDITTKISDNKINYDINTKVTRNNIVSDIDFTVKITEKMADSFKNKDISDSIKVSELTAEDKNIIDLKLASDKYLDKYVGVFE